VAFADLVLPDTTYLERHDVLSIPDRPISEFEGPVDTVRIPVLAPKGECKRFQEVLIELRRALDSRPSSARTGRASTWTWNAVGKAAGAWGLTARADEARKGFLLNRLISEELPPTECGEHVSNSDPVTGQAAWFDVRVRVCKAGPDEPKVTSPQFSPMPLLPGQGKRRGRWQAYVAGLFGQK
jgi:hypothetical protein